MAFGLIGLRKAGHKREQAPGGERPEKENPVRSAEGKPDYSEF